MEISKEQFQSSAAQAGIPKSQTEALWNALEVKSSEAKSSPFSQLLFYFGAMIVIGAMSWLFNLGWERFGGGGMFLIALAYGTVLTLVGSQLWKREDLKVPAGLLITIAVFMVPLAIYGLETYFNIWPEAFQNDYRDFYHAISSSWIWMDIGTIIAGLIALKYFHFPFITVPIYLAAWFLIMDITPLIVGNDASIVKRQWISLIFGLVLLAIAYVIDMNKKRDYAFWGYLFGTFTFWAALSMIAWDGHGEFPLFIYFLINLVMMFASVLLKRKVLLIFGAMGVFAYLSHLASEIFQDSLLFPFVLSIMGLLVIYLGVLYQRNEKAIEQRMLSWLPSWIKNALPLDS